MVIMFQAIIKFKLDEDFVSYIPKHRTYINYLINKGVIDSYAVSMESHRCWITLNTDSKQEAQEYIEKAPTYKYWTVKIEELYLFDSQRYRLPALQLN